MMNKDEYRSYFIESMKYIKLTKIAEEAGVHVSNMSKFLKGPEYDFLMSQEKCQLLYNAVQDTLCGIVDVGRRDKTVKRIKKFTEDRDWDQYHTPVNLAKSIAIEAGELLECFQWSDTEYDKGHVCEELADVMNYCIQMADKLDVDLDQIINDKIDMNEKKYPVEKAKGKADKYTEL